MPSWLPSYPYPPSKAGYWEPVTSTLDWCEENYYATTYSAEVVNTFTNLLFLYLGARGAWNCYTQGHDRIFLICFLGYLIVGSGSFCFHATLKYPWQLVDELSMIYTTCLMFFATFGYNKSTRAQIGLVFFLLSLAAGITLYYHYLQDPTFHQTAYAILTAVVLLRAIWIMEVNVRPSTRRKRAASHVGAKKSESNGHANGQMNSYVHVNGKLAPAEANGTLTPTEKKQQEKDDEKDLDTLKTMWIMIAYGLTIFLGGFALWNVDNFYCSKLKSWRHELGLPWGILLEGHGWWHLMTGVGAYFYIVWGIWLRHHLNGTQDQVKLVWPRLITSMPEIVRKDGKSANGGVMSKKDN